MAVNELDAKTRAVEKMKAEPGKEVAAYQAAENQLLAIRAEQKQNLALARQEGAAAIQQNAMMGQVGELVASSGGGAVRQAPVNAATQNVLAKYGAGPTISKSTQRSTQQITKQNITINNYNTTTNNTTNNVPNTGPVQGRPVVVNRDDTGRFKVWVSNALARQNEQAAIRDKEYQRRESALTRSANKMTRKLEAISSNISKNLDPRRQATTFGEQIKRILKLIGIGVIAANWPKVLDILGNIEKKTRTFLEYVGITGRKERKRTGQETGLVKDIKYLLLGENADKIKGGLFGAIREFFTGEKGLLNTVKKSFKLWLENRGKAIKAIDPPDTSFLHPSESIKNLMEYLKQVFGVILGGPGSALKQVASQAREEGANEMTADNNIYHKKSGYKTKSGKHISYGDAASAIHDVDSANAKYHVMQEDIKDDGSLKNNLGASLRQSAYLANNFSGGKLTGGKINVTGILEGLSRLEKTASESKEKTTLVDPKFIKALEKIGVNIEALKLNGKLKEYGYVTRKKTDDEKAEEFAQNSGLAKAVGWTSGITASALTTFLSGGINPMGGVAAGVYTGDQIKKLSEQWAQSKTSEDLVFQLRPKGLYEDNKYYSLSQESGKKKYFKYYELTDEDMKEIKSQLGKLTGRNEDFSYNAEDIASTTAMADLLLKKAGPDAKLSDSFSKNIQELTELEKENAEYEAEQKKVWDESVVSGIGERAKELAQEAKEFTTTGYTDSIGGDSDGEETTGDVEDVKSIKKKDSWDVDKAIDTVKKNALSKSSRHCLRHVGNAISAGFGKETPIGSYEGTKNDPNFRVVSAKDSGASLLALGFSKIPNDSGLQRGDIRVYQAGGVDKKGNSHPDGHIEMFDGSDWFSDFKQANTGAKWGYYPSYATYRWKNDEYDGDLIDETTTVAPVETASQGTALAQQSVPELPEQVCSDEFNSYMPSNYLDHSITPTSTTINTPVLAENSYSLEQAAKQVAAGTAENRSRENSNGLVLVEKMDELKEAVMLGAEASARNVDATTEVAATVAASRPSQQSAKQTAATFTPPLKNGEIS